MKQIKRKKSARKRKGQIKEKINQRRGERKMLRRKKNARRKHQEKERKLLALKNIEKE